MARCDRRTGFVEDTVDAERDGMVRDDKVCVRLNKDDEDVRGIDDCCCCCC